ncbi:hypothetical protein [Orientia tsutsugamushi]|uniref:Uncharacterized protein n=1 Tax=Orientia tsutsugamushi str. TA716 TaxID=1359175 RepID=A0A0F3P9T9_ORITS|nr:hypothetical protein [Orientia tsutsugamushi]KJV77048.1 hypothetical protein OTSTA716_0480 [Orientia tsutsugamushi str. TA716]
MRDVYSFITKAVQQVTSNTTTWMKDCILIPGDSIREVLISGADAAGQMAFKCYSICGRIFINYLNKFNSSYINSVDGPYSPMTVLHSIASDEFGFITYSPDLNVIFPANFTSVINDSDIVVAKVQQFNNNHDINATLMEWSKQGCKLISECSIELLVNGYNEMNANNDESNLSTASWILSGSLAAAGCIAALVAYKKCKKNADININIDHIEETKKHVNMQELLQIEPVVESQYEVSGAAKDSSVEIVIS